MVPLPKDDNYHSTIMELMKKTHSSSLPEKYRYLIEFHTHLIFIIIVFSIGPVLSDYLKNNTNRRSSTDVSHGCNFAKVDAASIKTSADNLTGKKNNKVGISKHKLMKIILEPNSCNKLVDMCAKFVLEHENSLKKMYEHKNSDVWKYIDEHNVNSQEIDICYNIIKDTNKKRKWLRMMDNEETMAEVFEEEYGESDVFVKERHLFEFVNTEPYQFTDALDKAVFEYVKRC